MQFSEYLALVGQIYVALGQCVADYMEWFQMISNPYISLTQPGDPPKNPLMVNDDTFIKPNLPQQSIIVAAMPKPPAPADVDMPRHAVV